MAPADLAAVGPDLPLRDIRLPEPPAWWPPAPGWWLVAALVGAMLAGCIWWFLRHRRLSYRRQALLELSRLAATMDLASPALLAAVSALLRRAAVCAFGPAACAGLAGGAWLGFLDQRLSGNLFSQGPGRCLAEGPFQPDCAVDRQALFDLSRRWLRGLPPAPARGRRS